jgi:hypothetical protein
MIDKMEKSLQQHPKMPLILKAFICYGVLLMVLDMVSVTKVSIAQAIVASIGWVASIFYYPPLVWLIMLKLTTIFPKKIRFKNQMWLRYLVLVLMLFEIMRYVVFSEFLRHANHEIMSPYLYAGYIRFFVSVVMPAIWIYVWFSRSVSRYIGGVCNETNAIV